MNDRLKHFFFLPEGTWLIHSLPDTVWLRTGMTFPYRQQIFTVLRNNARLLAVYGVASEKFLYNAGAKPGAV